MSDRGMKKWNAYKALVEQYEALDQNVNNKTKYEKPILSVDKEEEINSILVNYHGQELIFKYFHNRKPLTCQSTIRKIDIENRRLILANGTIVLLEELTDICSVNR